MGLATQMYQGPKLNVKHGHIDLSHGAGGRATHILINQLFLKYLSNPLIKDQNDAAVIRLSQGQFVMSTDAHVISPVFFPGGNIGSLAVHGTINDIAMMGGKPLYITLAFIIEEGFPLSDLEQIVISIATAAREANVEVIAGDTKVVEKGKGDGIFIASTGFGLVPDGIRIGVDRVSVNDDIIISGFVGDHGVSILAAREHLSFNTDLVSDTKPLHGLVNSLLSVTSNIHCMRDPTRGGLATALNEIAYQAKLGMVINESAIPIREEVQGACELYGMDALYMANEGKCIIICPKSETHAIIDVLKHHPDGRNAAVIGHVVEDERGLVQLKTKLGGVRLLDWMMGDQLPRIC